MYSHSRNKPYILYSVINDNFRSRPDGFIGTKVSLFAPVIDTPQTNLKMTAG